MACTYLPEAFLPRQSVPPQRSVGETGTSRQREQKLLDFAALRERFLHVEAWQIPLARQAIHFIRLSDLTHMTLRSSVGLPLSRMAPENVETLYRHDQAAVNTTLRHIGGLAVYVEDAEHGVNAWMRMIEWRGASETDPTMHTWLPLGQEGTDNTVELSIDALAEMEAHVARYAPQVA